MARGAEAKNIVTAKILETFEGAFPYDKEIRIPIAENGEIIQIKVTLTCAKVNVENGGDVAIPGNRPPLDGKLNFEDMPAEPVQREYVAPTADEKANISNLLAALGL